jgi:dimethylglycine dehydrogenase
MRRLRTFIVETDRTDVIGDEPIWFGEQVRGWVTSGGYAHGSGVSVALGYVDKDIAESDGPWSIEILGRRFAARMQRVPLFDPAGVRQRG